MSLTLRSARREDADAVLELRRSAILSGCAGHYDSDDLAIWTEGGASEAFLADLEREFFLVEAEGQLVGSGMINLDNGRVDAIFTHPDWTGKGVASTLMALLESLARAQRLTRLSLDATLNAAPFYRHCGFEGEAVAEYHSPKGITLACIPMEKVLD